MPQGARLSTAALALASPPNKTQQIQTEPENEMARISLLLFWPNRLFSTESGLFNGWANKKLLQPSHQAKR
jgi:hypothetical protein